MRVGVTTRFHFKPGSVRIVDPLLGLCPSLSLTQQSTTSLLHGKQHVDVSKYMGISFSYIVLLKMAMSQAWRCSYSLFLSLFLHVSLFLSPSLSVSLSLWMSAVFFCSRLLLLGRHQVWGSLVFSTHRPTRVVAENPRLFAITRGCSLTISHQ